MTSAYLDAMENRLPASRAARAPAAGLRHAALVQTLAALIWIPQAGLLSTQSAALPMAAASTPSCGQPPFSPSRHCKSCLDAAGAAWHFARPRRTDGPPHRRRRGALARRSPIDSTRQNSGEAASISASRPN
jgi:hypothetical protein